MRQFGNALEPEVLSPRNIGQARLLVRGTPGQMVELLEWTDFVKYLDELRGARRHGAAAGLTVLQQVRRAGQASRDSGGVQASHGAVRRCCSFDGHRRDRRCGAATRDHGRSRRTAARKWCSAMEAQSTSSPVTASSAVGAPAALEDHAIRACLAALGVQDEAKRLAVDVQDRDSIDLRLRVGLNSGQVIAGEIGSGSFGYTAVGEQVGMAQRIESVAPPGRVMLSASTARLVDGAAALGGPEMPALRVPRNHWPPIGCWASASSVAASAVRESNCSVGAGGSCPRLRACCSAPSMATAQWSPWLGHRALARAVWCERSPR